MNAVSKVTSFLVVVLTPTSAVERTKRSDLSDFYQSHVLGHYLHFDTRSDLGDVRKREVKLSKEGLFYHEGPYVAHPQVQRQVAIYQPKNTKSVLPQPQQVTPSPVQYHSTPYHGHPTPEPQYRKPTPTSYHVSPFQYSPTPYYPSPTPYQTTAKSYHASPTKYYGTPTPYHTTATPYHVTPTPYHGTPTPYHGTPTPYHGTPASYRGTPSHYQPTPAPYHVTPTPYYGTPTSYHVTPTPYTPTYHPAPHHDSPKPYHANKITSWMAPVHDHPGQPLYPEAPSYPNTKPDNTYNHGKLQTKNEAQKITNHYPHAAANIEIAKLKPSHLSTHSIENHYSPLQHTGAITFVEEEKEEKFRSGPPQPVQPAINSITDQFNPVFEDLQRIQPGQITKPNLISSPHQSGQQTLFQTITRDAPDRPARKKLSKTSKKHQIPKSDALQRLMAIAGENWDAEIGIEKNLLETASDNFNCPAPEGHFPDPDSCSVYFQCAQGTPHKRTCEPGLNWNMDTNQCDWEANVDCSRNLGYRT